VSSGLANTHPALRPFWHPVALEADAGWLEYRRMLIDLVNAVGQ
jgi:hypothetical protein